MYDRVCMVIFIFTLTVSENNNGAPKMRNNEGATNRPFSLLLSKIIAIKSSLLIKSYNSLLQYWVRYLCFFYYSL